METSKLLLVARTKSVLDLVWTCGETEGWQLQTVGSPWEALERVNSGPGPDLIVLDLMLGDSDGLHSLRWLRRVRPDLPVVVLANAVPSNHDETHKLEALRLGAADYLSRPLQSQSLQAAIQQSLLQHGGRLETELAADEIEQIGGDMFFVAASPSMRKLRAQAELLAQVGAPVLISGENGTGKDLAARLIHKLSVRSGFRFLKINCATLPGDVLETELLSVANANGHAKPGELDFCQPSTCCWMTSPKCRWACRPNCAPRFCAMGILCGRAARTASRWMCASWPPRRSVWNTPWRSASCAKISTTV